MAALHLPTPMLKTPTTSVAEVPAHTVNPSSSTLPANNLKGEKMVGSIAAWNQQVVAHKTITDKKEILELEILKQASLRDFEDDIFLKRLRLLRGSVGGEMWKYRELLRSTLEFSRVVVKPKHDMDMREIILKTDDRLFHILRDLLKLLTFTELEVIEKKVKCFYQEDEMLKNLLKEEMDAAHPEVYMKPQCITYKINNRVGYFRVPKHLKPSNKSLIMHLH